MATVPQTNTIDHDHSDNSNAIDSTLTPGTVHLVDLTHTLRTAHSPTNTSIILHPTPSPNNPNDPLTWSRHRKLLHLTSICIYVWFTGICNSLVYSVETPLASALDLSVADINAGTGYLFLLCGWGLLFWQPFALQYGKRPTYIISTFATVALTLWGPYARGKGQWIAKNILGGFFAAPIEALPEISVADVFFSHERGTYMGVYAFVLAGRVSVGVLLSGDFLCGGGCVFGFGLEETNFERGVGSEVAVKEVASSPGITTPVVAVENEGNEEKKSATLAPAAGAETSSVSAGSIFPRKRNYLKRLALWDTQTSRPQRMPYRALLSLRLLSWPLVFYAGFSYGSYLIWFNVLNGTASLILSSAPYNFSSSMVGLSYLACILGVAAAAVYTGPLSDWLTLKLARRNKGVFEPEQRLLGFGICLLVLPASLLLWGVGAANGVHWFGLLVAMCGTAFCNCCGITLSVNYLVDSYPSLGSDGMTTVIIIRNTMSFAIGYGITPWFEGMGAEKCFVSAAFVGLAACAVFVPVVWKGKRLREKSKGKYWDLVRKHVEMGMVH